MALPTAPGVVELTIKGQWSNGRPCDNVLHYSVDTSGFSVTRHDAAVALADDVIQNWQSQVMGGFSNNYSVLGIRYVDLNSEDGSTGERPPNSGSSTSGGGTAASTTPNVAFLVHKLVSSGRGVRSGRIYAVGVPEGSVDEDGFLSSLSAYQTEWEIGRAHV